GFLSSLMTSRSLYNYLTHHPNTVAAALDLAYLIILEIVNIRILARDSHMGCKHRYFAVEFGVNCTARFKGAVRNVRHHWSILKSEREEKGLKKLPEK
ncbi:MAG: hypothetical protein O7G31_17075, partial [Calditrichaeota bacterium]|nr:hypothetical protein [Calditrichota bacterium]